MLTRNNKHSFCPDKWQEIVFNPHENYLYSCCNSSKMTHYNKPEDLEQQRQNSLNGIQDPSCDYCWKAEAKSKTSRRITALKNWDGTLNLHRLEINLGNLCNLYCSYCGPKFSSRWNSNLIKNGPYNILFDKNSMELSQLGSPDPLELVDFVKTHQPTKFLSIIGGEPLINPLLLDVITCLTVTGIQIQIPTNLMIKDTHVFKDILSKSLNHIVIQPSIDGLGETNKFLRYGFDKELFDKNLQYLLENADVTIEFLTLITAQSVWDFIELQQYIHDLNFKFPNRIEWNIEYCNSPLTHSFDVLTEDEQQDAISTLTIAMHRSIIKNEKETLKSIIGVIHNSKYNYLLRQDVQHFFKQFAERNNTQIPNSLTFLYQSC